MSKDMQCGNVANGFPSCAIVIWQDDRIAELEAALEQAALRESASVAFEIKMQSKLQGLEQMNEHLKQQLLALSAMKAPQQPA
jgi:small-conductance mechanosensitive channel